MKLFIRGKGKVELNADDFVAQGGEGSIYIQGDLAYKIYNDPARMIPAAKIQELSVLTLPSIVRPQEVLLNSAHTPIGYTMRPIKDVTALCQLFTRAFRERKGLLPESMPALVQKLREGVAYVHRHGMLIVDLHEMNFLIDLPLKEVLFIDVDSYQTPSFPATALMDSIRDRHTKGFHQNTDWFAFGIVSFQLFVGIHPFKGKHPDGLDLDARMVGNISVFNKAITLPKVCYPFQVIPQAYRDWYEAIFEKGNRCPPPDTMQQTIYVSPPISSRIENVHLSVREVQRFPARIVAPFMLGSGFGAVTTEGVVFGRQRLAQTAEVMVAFTPRMQRPIAAWREGDRLRLHDLMSDHAVITELVGAGGMEYGGRLYVNHGTAFHEVQFLELPNGIQATLKQVGNALRHGTQLFDGVGVQRAPGACFITVFPQAGVCHTIRIPALDAYRIVNARYRNQVLMVIGSANGRYDRLIFRFDPEYRAWDLRMEADVAEIDLNFVTLDNGVCIRMVEGELELFSHRCNAIGLRRVSASGMEDARLFHVGVQVFCTRGDTLYSLTMR